MKKIAFSLIVLSVLNACGPSAAEIEKTRTDIEQAAHEELLRQQEHAREQQALKNKSIELRSTLAGEEVKMQEIEGFHLFRSDDEKAQQVTDQTRIIEEIKSEISEIEKKIDD